MIGALDSLRVLELGTSTSSAYAGKLLADLGAEVIKLEAPGSGDPTRADGPFRDDRRDGEGSGRFLYLNTNKRSVTVDVGSDTGRDVVGELCALVDVVVSSAQPQRQGGEALQFDALVARNPRLIMASITPFGERGPYRDRVGYDLNTGALGGINYYLGEAGREPLAPPLAIGEYQAGLNAAVAVLVSVVAETVPQHLDISEADCWATVQNGQAIVEFVYGGRLHTRRGKSASGGMYPYSVFHCKDGRVRLQVVQRREWQRLLQVLGDPDWGRDPRYQDMVKNNELYSEELDALIEDWMKDKTMEEIFALCREGAVPCAPVYTIDEVTEHPDLGQWLVDVTHAGLGNSVRQAGFPYTLAETPPAIRKGAPLLGEDTASVLAEIGFDAEGLADLRAEAVI